MHRETKITRHVKVKGEVSPCDGNYIYWASRMGKHCHNIKTIRDLLIIQRHKYRKIWNRHFIKVHKQFEKSKWMWIKDIPTLV